MFAFRVPRLGMGRFLARKLVGPTGHKRSSQAEEYLAVETLPTDLPWIPIPVLFRVASGRGWPALSKLKFHALPTSPEWLIEKRICVHLFRASKDWNLARTKNEETTRAHRRW